MDRPAAQVAKIVEPSQHFSALRRSGPNQGLATLRRASGRAHRGASGALQHRVRSPRRDHSSPRDHIAGAIVVDRPPGTGACHRVRPDADLHGRRRADRSRRNVSRGVGFRSWWRQPHLLGRRGLLLLEGRGGGRRTLARRACRHALDRAAAAGRAAQDAGSRRGTGPRAAPLRPSPGDAGAIRRRAGGVLRSTGPDDRRSGRPDGGARDRICAGRFAGVGRRHRDPYRSGRRGASPRARAHDAPFAQS